MKGFLLAALVAASLGWSAFPATAGSDELVLDFGKFRPGDPPAEYLPALTGGGPPPVWKVLELETTSAFAPLTAQAQARGGNAREVVIAETSGDRTEERYPLLIYQPAVFADFTAELTFRAVEGRVDRMAGLAFRLQDPTNYYIVRASASGNSFRFYKFVDGVRSEPVGIEIPVPVGEWHTLEVSAKGNLMSFKLNGRQAIPPLNDSSFLKGRLALWTKSDSLSHFRQLRVTYDPLKTLPQRLVERAAERHSRLEGITIYALEDGRVLAVASSDEAKVGKPGETAEREAIEKGQISASSKKGDAVAVFPLRDRNGEPLFAVRLNLRSFPGQTDNNVAARARLVVEDLGVLMRSASVGGE